MSESDLMSTDEAGSVQTRGNACVLLSGGMDSVACLHWALAKYRDVRALAFRYGQPHVDAELTAAGRIAKKNGVPFETIAIADALHAGILTRVPEHSEGPSNGLHRAFVPGRNLVFLSLALSRACQWWRSGDIDIVVGSCQEDAGGFPDCRDEFMKATSKALSSAVDRKIHVAAPWVKMPKADILRDVSKRFPSGLADIQTSWSCYTGKGPCGACTACVMRARAFEAYGLADECAEPVMVGGDVGRERGYV
jgi:7-cyano-7-deazaguanine synthase